MSVAERFEDLLAWPRMHELSVEVWRATEDGAVARDWKFRDQVRDAPDSAERNVAEGFDRYDSNDPNEKKGGMLVRHPAKWRID